MREHEKATYAQNSSKDDDEAKKARIQKGLAALNLGQKPVAEQQAARKNIYKDIANSLKQQGRDSPDVL